jgi:hypothetical protein
MELCVEHFGLMAFRDCMLVVCLFVLRLAFVLALVSRGICRSMFYPFSLQVAFCLLFIGFVALE